MSVSLIASRFFGESISSEDSLIGPNMPLAFMASKILRMCTPVCWFTQRDDRDPCGLPSMSERTVHLVTATCSPVASGAALPQQLLRFHVPLALARPSLDVRVTHPTQYGAHAI